MLAEKHKRHLNNIIAEFGAAGYEVQIQLLNAKYHNVPQDRLRLIFVGYHRSLGKSFQFPHREIRVPTLRDAIWDLQDRALPAKAKNKANGAECMVPNHEYFIGGFSPRYMARNRVRAWDEPSFTIQASGRHAPLHPQANKMVQVHQDKRVFDENSPAPYRRLSMRECARIQTFPDDFVFYYDDLDIGYKMVGNAVPVNLAFALASKIYNDLFVHSDATIEEKGKCAQSTALSQLSLDLH